MQHLIPTCYFPTTALFLDDSHDFLLNFVLQLDEGVAYRIFDAPKQALEYLNQKNNALELLRRDCLSEYTNSKNCPLTNHTINLDLAAIHKEIYNANRFSEVSVVVVDYAMPGMNGIEFCRLIDNPKIKKILLTGQADEKVAIQAFNEGLIHRYVKKSDINAAEIITKSIHDLQIQYFQTMSEMIVNMLSVTSPSCLADKKFAQFFRDLCRENKIVEYYLADNTGSFLMLDEDGNTSFLIVKSQNELRLYYDLALDNGADENVLDALLSGEKIPAFWQAKASDPNWYDWSRSLVSSSPLAADQIYYYAYQKENVLFDISQQKIHSYQLYLEELDAEELMLNSTSCIY